MKRAGIVVGAVLLLALTGCTQSTDVDAAPEVSETTAPLVAEAPAESVDGEQAYLEYVRENLPEKTVIPGATDAQLIEAGMEACEKRAAGESTETISVIAGEEPNGLGYFDDSGVIVSGSGQFLCS